MCELREVRLKLIFLQQQLPGRLGYMYANGLQVLGLPDQLHELTVKIDEELACVWVPNQQWCLQASALLPNAPEPGLVPVS